MKIASERHTHYSAFQLVFYTFAMAIDRQTLLEKRWLAAMALSLVFTVYAVSILSILQAAGFEVIEHIGRHWPWSSENTRSFKNVGTIFVILFGLPAMVFWLRIGDTVSGDFEAPAFNLCARGFHELVFCKHLCNRLHQPWDESSGGGSSGTDCRLCNASRLAAMAAGHV